MKSQREEFGASRADLIRYAGATRDWNPIHWDHRSAVAAGLPGIVVHGLLQSAWILRSVVTGLEGTAPLASARFRYRAPLLVGQPASFSFERAQNEITGSLTSQGTERVGATMQVR